MNIKQIISDTCAKSGVPHLTESILYTFSRRFTRRLGEATYHRHNRSAMIKFSLPLWDRATEQQRHNVIVHETCHVVAFHKANLSTITIRPHGPEWAREMRVNGLEPERCHTVDRTGLARRLPTVTVSCGCRTHQLTTNRVTRMRKGQKYQCRLCLGPIVLV